MSYTTRIRLFLFTAITLLGVQPANAFPTGGGGTCFFCSPYTFGGSIISFELNSNDLNNNAPVMFNFLEDPLTPGTGRLCISGKLNATIIDGTETGSATYELLGSDNSNRGVCYQNVTQTCESITDATVGSCNADKCTYTVPALDDANINVADLLDGRFKVDTSSKIVDPITGDLIYPTGLYADCIDDDDPNTPFTPPNFCNFEVGFGFDGAIPPNFFPATTTLNNEPVDANVVLYANEVCIECTPDDLGLLPGTLALKSKSDTLRACEALAVKTDWCNDLQSLTGPNCIGDPNNPPIGGMNTAMGDFQNQDDSNTICIADMEDLKTLPSCDTEVALAACGDGPGYLTFPETYELTSCVDNSGEIFYFSAAEGSGTAIVNVGALGANPDAPGYAGDNTIPQILAGWTAIISTPDNQVNIWDFSESTMHRIAFTHSRNNNDEITGWTGSDNILGGSGADILRGNDGDDILQGGDNVDQLFGENGNDLLLGYECDGPNANCSSFSNNGNDNDILSGGAGNDSLDGGRGSDHLTGGAGSDAFILFGNVDNDTITDFNPGAYDPADPGEIDVIVNLTGANISTAYTRASNKNGTPDTCLIKVGGDTIALEDGTGASLSKTACAAVEILTALPAGQGTGHPSSF